MVEDIFDILTKFVVIAGTIEYGFEGIKILVKMYEKLKSLRVRRHK